MILLVAVNVNAINSGVLGESGAWRGMGGHVCLCVCVRDMCLHNSCTFESLWDLAAH